MLHTVYEQAVSVLAIDWSGALHGADRRIWLAEARAPGQLVRLEAGRDRLAMQDHLLDQRGAVAIGLDFAFSFPAWFLESLAICDAPHLWRHAAENGEAWLARCESPFWGRPARPRLSIQGAAFRRTELGVPRTAGIAPKSVFQVGGAGAVGTGSLRGMRLLHALHQAGARIWPYAARGAPNVVEIYPRLLTGAVNKSSPAARAALLAERYPALAHDHWRAACASEDAFDAAVSALVMIEHVDDLATLPGEDDPLLRLEGRIWHPAWRLDLDIIETA